MTSPPEKSRFLAAVGIGWAVLAAAGVVYARSKGIPGRAAYPLLAALLLEYPFYLVLAFPTLRERLAGRWLPLYVVGTAIAPYLIACLGAARFEWIGLLQLFVLAVAIGCWYVVLPAVAVVDLAFLALFPAALLGGYLERIYTPAGEVRRELIFLGHFTLIQMAFVVLMVARKVRETGFGFIPTWREWRIGAVHYVYFAATGIPLALALKAVEWSGPAPAWKIAGTFLGFLWVIALSEEFLFRGVLQQWVEKWTWSRTAALAIVSVLFGLVHLGFRGFPNWRWALLAALLGWCCGRARNQAGGIRAGVVTHSLVVATLRGFFA
jgi:membrane protease YdiL (CAAX protease family)